MIKEIYIVLKHYDYEGFDIDSCWKSEKMAIKRKKELENGQKCCDKVGISKQTLWDYSDA
jgi:hypothetical protein